MSTAQVVQDPEVRIARLQKQITALQKEQTKLFQKSAKAKRAKTRVGQKEWTPEQQKKLQGLPDIINRKNLEILRLIAAARQM